MVKDTIELNAFNKIKMPKLKGHIKLTLHNCRTGKNEVYEGNNIVTNAVADILGANIAGGVDFNSLAPLWQKWYGGALCYESAFPLNNGSLDPTDYFIPADSTNHIIAHAGQTAIDTDHDDDSTRGNPVGASVVQTSDSIKLVWEWGTVKGNGNISAIALTHTDTGSYGTGGNYYSFINNFTPYSIINRTDSAWNSVVMPVKDKNMVVSQYDDANSLNFFLGEDNFEFSTISDKVTVYINKLAYSKTGLYQTPFSSDTLGRKFTVQTPITFYSMPCYHFDYENKYLWLFTNITGTPNVFDNTNVRYCIIDCVNETLVNLGTEQSEVYYKTIISDTANIAPLTIIDRNEWFVNTNIFKYGDYVYFPTATSPHMGNRHQNIDGYKKISLVSASQTQLTVGETIARVPTVMGSEGIQIILYNPASINNSFVVNGDSVWKCKNELLQSGESTQGYMVSSPYNVSTIVSPVNRYRSSLSNKPRYILANKLVNTTKYNLSSTITKNATQSMSLEYTLQEVSGT